MSWNRKRNRNTDEGDGPSTKRQKVQSAEFESNDDETTEDSISTSSGEAESIPPLFSEIAIKNTLLKCQLIKNLNVEEDVLNILARTACGFIAQCVYCGREEHMNDGITEQDDDWEIIWPNRIVHRHCERDQDEFGCFYCVEQGLPEFYGDRGFFWEEECMWVCPQDNDQFCTTHRHLHDERCPGCSPSAYDI